jgi:hypothetical protein
MTPDQTFEFILTLTAIATAYVLWWKSDVFRTLVLGLVFLAGVVVMFAIFPPARFLIGLVVIGLLFAGIFLFGKKLTRSHLGGLLFFLFIIVAIIMLTTVCREDFDMGNEADFHNFVWWAGVSLSTILFFVPEMKRMHHLDTHPPAVWITDEEMQKNWDSLPPSKIADFDMSDPNADGAIRLAARPYPKTVHHRNF